MSTPSSTAEGQTYEALRERNSISVSPQEHNITTHTATFDASIDAPPPHTQQHTASHTQTSSPPITLKFRTLTGQLLTIDLPTLAGVTVADIKNELQLQHGTTSDNHHRPSQTYAQDIMCVCVCVCVCAASYVRYSRCIPASHLRWS